MKHYRIFSFILLFICAAFGQSCSISFSGREVLDMNTDWAFYRGGCGGREPDGSG